MPTATVFDPPLQTSKTFRVVFDAYVPLQTVVKMTY